MSWHAKRTGAYSRDSTEAQDNAKEIYDFLHSKGWSLNAVAAILGNFQNEGGMNPWRWESDIIRGSGGTSGYGLAQFTPGSKYIQSSRAKKLQGYNPNYLGHNGKPVDGRAQVDFIDRYADYYPTATYPLSYDSFKTSTNSPEELAAAWVYNYERPLYPSATLAQRKADARFYFDYLGGYSPVPPPPIRGGGKLKVIYYPHFF